MNSKTANEIVRLESRLREIDAFLKTYIWGAWWGIPVVICGLSEIRINKEQAKVLIENERIEVINTLKFLGGGK